MEGSSPERRARLRALVAPLRAEPRASLLAFDFDGTLSAVVDDPAAAVPVPGAVERLAALAERYRSVAVLSGRPVSFLQRHVPDQVDVSGLYGLEERVGGMLADHPDAEPWRSVIAAAADASTEAVAPGRPLAGIVVEPKGLSLTLHARTRPELEDQLVAFAVELGARLGLDVRPAKRSVELHPPIAADKGSALRSLVLASGATRVLFVGDDVGDVPAFDAAVELHRRSALEVVVLAAVGGPELPDAVAERAAMVLANPTEVVELLDALEPDDDGGEDGSEGRPIAAS